jgi:hypothetical protein
VDIRWLLLGRLVGMCGVMMVHYGSFTSLCGVGKADGGWRRGKRDRARKAIDGLFRARFGEIDQELMGVIP